MTTKRAGPERAFERDALKVHRATAHSTRLRALTRERRAGTRREPVTPRLQPTHSNRRELLARVGERHKVFPVSRPRCATCSPPLRAGAPAARRQAEVSSRCDRPTGGELPADQRRAVAQARGADQLRRGLSAAKSFSTFSGGTPRGFRAARLNPVASISSPASPSLPPSAPLHASRADCSSRL